MLFSVKIPKITIVPKYQDFVSPRDSSLPQGKLNPAHLDVGAGSYEAGDDPAVAVDASQVEGSVALSVVVVHGKLVHVQNVTADPGKIQSSFVSGCKSSNFFMFFKEDEV